MIEFIFGLHVAIAWIIFALLIALVKCLDFQLDLKVCILDQIDDRLFGCVPHIFAVQRKDAITNLRMPRCYPIYFKLSATDL